MYFTATFVASLLVSANALATPHVGHGLLRRHQHSALAKARAAAPEPILRPLEASAAVPRKQLRKRCKSRTTSSALQPSSSSADGSSAAPASSGAADPANVAPLPVPTSQAAPSSASPPPPAPAASAKPAPSSSAAPSPQPAPAPSPSPSSGGGGQSNSLFSGTQSGGDGTFYGTGLGACGITNNDSQFIAAVSEQLFDVYPGYNGVNPNTNPVCGKKVNVNFQGKSVTVTITDRCVKCNPKDLDFSPAAFNLIADPAVGRIHGISWTWQ